MMVPMPGTSSGRDNATVQPMNMPVPGANVQDALTTRPAFTFDNFTDFVLGMPGVFAGISRSQIEWAENLAPTTAVVWLGSNDALGVVFTGDPSALTPIPMFQAAYAEVTTRMAATGATLIFANVPDVTVVAYLTSVENLAAQARLPLSVIGPILGVASGDFVTPDAFQLIQARIADPSLGPLPGNVVLDAGEVATIRSTVDAYNKIIAGQAQALGAALVDIHSITADLQSDGFVAGGQQLTTSFLGGLFSLDGIHPTDTGYAIFANAFINQLNRTFAAGIPPVAVEQIKAADPLVLRSVGHPSAALGHISPESVRALRAVMLHQ
jgi:hypothetical protein